MPKVSVIVPVYGVEKYIERCARSLFEQTLDDMEFIFVDDCTKDNSIQVLERVIEDYPNRKEQIKILHHEHNKGLSHARETGVNAAVGEYIAHCDSDDWVEHNMYEELYVFASSRNADFVKCDHYISDDLQNNNVICPISIGDNASKEEVISLLLTYKGWNSIWNTLTKRELYTDVSYTDHAMLEDYYLVTQLLINSKNIKYLHKPLYHYYVNLNSICNKNTIDSYVVRALQAHTNASEILKFIEDKYGTQLYRKQSVVLKYIARRIIIPVMKDKSRYDIWNSIFPELKLFPLFSQHLSYKEKLQYLLVQLHLYRFYCFLFK